MFNQKQELWPSGLESWAPRRLVFKRYIHVSPDSLHFLARKGEQHKRKESGRQKDNRVGTRVKRRPEEDRDAESQALEKAGIVLFPCTRVSVSATAHGLSDHTRPQVSEEHGLEKLSSEKKGRG